MTKRKYIKDKGVNDWTRRWVSTFKAAQSNKELIQAIDSLWEEGYHDGYEEGERK